MPQERNSKLGQICDVADALYVDIMAALQQGSCGLVSRCKPSWPGAQRVSVASFRLRVAGSRRWRMRRPAAGDDGISGDSSDEEPGQEVPLREQAKVLNDLFYSSTAEAVSDLEGGGRDRSQEWDVQALECTCSAPTAVKSGGSAHFVCMLPCRVLATTPSLRTPICARRI